MILIMRTTIDIDDPILQDLKRLQRRDGKPLGRLISDLIAAALANQCSSEPSGVDFHWTSRPMNARVDLGDKHAVVDAMDKTW